MINPIKKIILDKKEYKQQLARADELPEEYLFVFYKIHDYIWRYAGGDGSDMIVTQNKLIELFEESAAEGKNVLDVTGEDVVGFCDELLLDTKKWTDRYRRKLNKDIANRFK